MIQNINKLFLLIIILSLLTFQGRADYNLPLFSFAIVLWNHKRPPQKIRVWYLILFSLLVDFIWIIYYAILWNSEEFIPFVFYNFTLIISSIMFIVKIVLAVILFIRDEVCRNAVFEIGHNISSLIKGE